MECTILSPSLPCVEMVVGEEERFRTAIRWALKFRTQLATGLDIFIHPKNCSENFCLMRCIERISGKYKDEDWGCLELPIRESSIEHMEA